VCSSERIPNAHRAPPERFRKVFLPRGTVDPFASFYFQRPGDGCVSFGRARFQSVKGIARLQAMVFQREFARSYGIDGRIRRRREFFYF
jgi:hypothetical protein